MPHHLINAAAAASSDDDANMLHTKHYRFTVIILGVYTPVYFIGAHVIELLAEGRTDEGECVCK